jgi:hypothetical protein
MFRKAAKNLAEAASTALNLATFRYPGFVYGGGLCAGYVPVFCMHGAEPESFEQMLDYLKSNSYRMLHADEYLSVLKGERAIPRRAVLLTFDDGWGSMWSTGFPLIKKYDAKIVIFLSPGRIKYRDRYRPNLDDLACGKWKKEDVTERDKSDQPLLFWEEIAEMHESGLVDFQSHSFSHGLVHKSLGVADFVHPQLILRCSFLELPCLQPEEPDLSPPASRLGEPLFKSAPRLSDTPRIFIDERIRESCMDYVRAYGHEEFFKSPNWRRELLSIMKRINIKSAQRFRTETREEQVRAIRFDLAEAKRRIEEMLPGKTVRHLCYPWHAAGRIAAFESVQAGYATNFWGKIGGRYSSPIPGNPLRIARVGGDFFFRLPGTGRAPFLGIIAGKAARRAREGSPYVTH